MNRLAPAHGRLTREIDFHFTEPQFRRRLALALHAPQQRPDARQQFLRAERLDQVVVRPRVQPGDAVLDLALGGEHEDGDGIREAAQLGADLEAVELRHHDIEQDEVGLFFEGQAQAGLAVGGGERA